MYASLECKDKRINVFDDSLEALKTNNKGPRADKTARVYTHSYMKSVSVERGRARALPPAHRGETSAAGH
ncbi:hypothetical protein J6590_011585 [Homalodisca vitripennis]|nr:hypothetical protein J6590_011585 [Homalodisca vitripennis]